MLDITKLNVCFCKNDYTKAAEFTIESSKINFQTIIRENIVDKEDTLNDMKYSILFGKLNFKYFYEKDKQFSLLTKRNIDIEENINDKDKELEIGDKVNQVEIKCDDNGYKININQNNIYVRIDCLILIYYYFKGSIPIDEVIDNLEQINLNDKIKSSQIEINFKNSNFQLTTSFDGKENLFLDIDKLKFIYNWGSEGKMPYGSYSITLNKITSNIMSLNNLRELCYTSDQFVVIQINIKENLIFLSLLIQSLTINLTYKDLLSFLKVYFINEKLFKEANQNGEKFLKNLEDNKKHIDEYKSYNLAVKLKRAKEIKDNNGLLQKSLPITGLIDFKKVNITLIENSKEIYHPFLNFILEGFYCNINPNKSLEATLAFEIFSYNYIACKWEPSIEKTSAKLINKYRSEPNISENKLEVQINNLNVNLSDMSISFTLLTFNNWFKNIEEKKKNYEDSNINNININIDDKESTKLKKVTNNKVINYTGIDLKLIHNKKEIICKDNEEIDLEYIQDDIKSNITYKCLKLIYEKEHIFEIPLERIASHKHEIGNNLLFVSENSISKNRTINISIYSRIIFKNLSNNPLLINIENKNIGNKIIELNPKSIACIPVNLVDEETKFKIGLVLEKKNIGNGEKDIYYDKTIYTLKEIFCIKSETKFKTTLNFGKKSLSMKLEQKIQKVKTFIINTEYSIINCLPCKLIFHYSQQIEKIEKCTQFFIDNNSESDPYIAFGLEILNSGIFESKGFKLSKLRLKKEDNYIELTKKGKSIKLLYYFKTTEEENTLIIYTEAIIQNLSKLKLNIGSKINGNQFCFAVSENICLMSSNLDYKEAVIQLYNGEYYSQTYTFSSLIEASPYKRIKMSHMQTNYVIYLNMKKKFSYMTIANNPDFRENIMTMVFNILPLCRIINLLSTQRFYVCDYEDKDMGVEVDPLVQKPFHFFGQGPNKELGVSIMNMNSNKCLNLIKFQFNVGVYTFSTEEKEFNIEIKNNPSDGCLDVFIVETTKKNCQIIMENLTNESICVYQENHAKYMQIISPKETQILKKFDNNLEFMMEAGNFYCCVDLQKIRKIELGKKITAVIEGCESKMKIIFYSTEEYKYISSSLNSYYFKLMVKEININVIVDNEYKDKTLKNYERNELFVIVCTDFTVIFNIDGKQSILDEQAMLLNIILNQIEIYNQISLYGKFPIILKT